MSRLNWNDRHSPTDFDNTAPTTPDYTFDYRRDVSPGAKSSWPERHQGEKFGPALIGKAWKAGMIVYAEIDGWPYPVAVQKAQWTANVLEVVTLDGPRIPRRLFTRPNAKGLTSSGLLIEEGE